MNSTYDNLVDVKAAGGNLYLSYNPSPRTSVSLNGMLHYLDLRAQEGMRFTIRMCVIPAFVGSALSISRRSLSTGGVLSCRVGTCVPSRMWGWTRTAFIFTA